MAVETERGASRAAIRTFAAALGAGAGDHSSRRRWSVTQLSPMGLDWVWTPALPFTSCVTSGKLLNLFVL